MRIESQIANGVEQTQKAEERSGPVAAETTLGDTGTSSHVASPELQSLLGTLGQIPQVRPAAVAAAAQKLTHGELSGPDVLDRTAAALLG